MRFTLFVALITLAVLPANSLSQNCVDTIAATFDPQQYEASKNGTVSDQKKRLMWTQCSLGQQFKHGQCIGTVHVLAWDAAIQEANNWKFAGYSDWRLPSVQELAAITELSCQHPAINLQVFPNTPAVDFWTATEFINNTNLSWRIHFGFGENHTAKKTTGAAVRLVRSIK